jgi:hypothetical protein
MRRQDAFALMLCAVARAADTSSAARSVTAPNAQETESSQTLCPKCGGGGEVASWNCCREGGSWQGKCSHLKTDGAAHTWIEGWYSCHPEAAEFFAKEPRTTSADRNEFTRLVYNRVPKAGSSLMDTLLSRLSQRNNFDIYKDQHYLPNATTLHERIRTLPIGGVYINHAGFDAAAAPSVAFMNLVREPLDRSVSLFYYGVDPATRPPDRAEECLENRAQAGSCGCAGQEADYCVYSQLGNRCNDECNEGTQAERYCQPFDDLDAGCNGVHRTYTQTMFFCPPNEERSDCDARTAARTARERYTFVGMVEEFELSVLALERLLPRWFDGAKEVLDSLPKSAHRATNATNALTHTLGSTSTLSYSARQILASRADNQLAFYDSINATFWRTVEKLGLANTSVQRDWEFDS